MAARVVDYARLRRTVLRSLSEGWGVLIRDEVNEGYVLRCVRWELQQHCEDPYNFELFARTSFVQARKWGPQTLWVVASSLCRKCAACVRSRRLFWTARAGTEFDMWPRTFLGTFTLSFENHLILDMEVERGNPITGRPKRPFSSLNEKGLFAARCDVFGEYLTDYLKRVRKQISTDFRYLLIAEAHDSENTSEELRGRPHYHILFHEKKAGALVRGDVQHAEIFGKDGEFEKRWVKTRKGWKQFLFATDEAELRKQWQLGHTKFQLCESSNSAVYVCKYVVKSAGVRPRASQRYGLLANHSATSDPPSGSQVMEQNVNLDPNKSEVAPEGDPVAGGDSMSQGVPAVGFMPKTEPREAPPLLATSKLRD